MTTLEGLLLGSSSSQSGTVGVPPLLGKTRTEAVQSLESLGLKAKVEEIETLGTVDTVYSQNPTPPAIRARGTVVTLQIIKAPGGTTTPPDLNKRLEEISNAVAALDALVRTVETDTAAAARQQAILDQLTTVVDKLDTIIAKMPKPGGGAAAK